MSLFPWRQARSPEKRDKGFGVSQFFQDVEQQFKALANIPSGLSVSSDEKNIYVQADVPGLTAKDVEVSVDDQDVLWIKGERAKEEKKRNYYKTSQSSFSYMLPLSDEIDTAVEPKAVCKNGVMTVTFAKKKEGQSESKKIHVKEE
jgi:HSP20 family protein